MSEPSAETLQQAAGTAAPQVVNDVRPEPVGPRAPRRPIAGNTATRVLKLIALVFMCCDHVGIRIFPGVTELRIIGRMAFPIYAWCLVVGFNYTRSVPKYALRLLAFGALSQPIYATAMNHDWLELNIFFELLIGLLGLWAIRQRWHGSHVWGPVAAMILAQLLCGTVSYGWKGVLFIFLLYAVQDRRAAIWALMVAFCLFWGANSSTVTVAFGIHLATLTRNAPWTSLLSPWCRLQAMAILAAPFILLKFPKDIRLPYWVSYMLYPGHLVILWVVLNLLGK